MTVTPPRHGGDQLAGRVLRNRWIPFAAAATAAVLTAGAVLAAGGGTAGAAAAPQAQSAGNFLDATLGGNTIDQLAKLEYAKATAPGAQSTQNPLNATLLNSINLPLTGALQLPNFAGITLGAVQQVAVAEKNGFAVGASGLVRNSGGVSIGGDNAAYPANASIDLCASALSGGKCGNQAPDALGELKLNVGAVSGLAKTPQGYGKAGSTEYQIASLGLQLGSPQIGALLGQVNTTVSGALTPITSALAPISTLLGGLFPSACTSPTALQLPTTIPIGSAITIDVTNATITIDLAKLVDLNNLPANTDLVKYLVANLPSILGTGLTTEINKIVTDLTTKVNACVTALTGISNNGLPSLLTTLTGAVTTLGTTLNGILTPITNAISPLLDAVSGLVDIGVNVQPKNSAGNFDTGLGGAPKQGTPDVYSTVVRAIEVDVLSGGNVNLQGAQRKAAAARKASNPLLAVALGNAAAGPSTAPAAASTPATPAPSTSVPATNVPTGVPAGQGSTGGTPALPIVLVGLAVLFAAGGAVSFRLRRLNNH